ncbi:MAG: leucyl/phenylalanyl-tRNA--protein transferase [Phycisphaerales bacterium]|nr:leucyl/phenylalanyl-tRNA--protein transferase [Phycisphaerales bacterium]
MSGESRSSDADLSPKSLLAAYAGGAFPMADVDTGIVEYFTCDPRCVIPLDAFRLPHTSQRAIRASLFRMRADTAFEQVMRGCMLPRPGQERTWISESMVEAYCKLHELGFAHSVEAWLDDKLVGGLYGVSLGGAFFGESMFVLRNAGAGNASKACLHWLVTHLKSKQFALLDSQYSNSLVLSFGGVEIPAPEYEARLAAAMDLDVAF